MSESFEELKRRMHAEMQAAVNRQWNESMRHAFGYSQQAGMNMGMGGLGSATQARQMQRETARLQGEQMARRIVKVCRQTAVTPRLRAQLKQEALKIVAEKAAQDPVLLDAMADGVRDYLNSHNIPVRF